MDYRDITQDIDFRTGVAVQIDGDLNKLTEYTDLLIQMVQARVEDDMFRQIVEFVFNFDKATISYMDDQQVQLHLRYCSQWRATFTTLVSELALLLEKADRHYKVWMAKRFEEAKAELIEEQKTQVKEGYRTKGEFGRLTKDDITNRILTRWEEDNERWNGQLDRIKRTHGFFQSLADDIKHRAMVLMSINKGQSQF